MKDAVKFNFVLLLTIIFSVSAFAQTPEAVEKELLGIYANINKNSAYAENSDGETLEKSNEEFKEKLLKYVASEATLKYEFGELAKQISIETSEDGKLRVYSWDRLDGGTMHFYETVYQFQTADGKVRAKSRDLTEGDSGSFVHDVFTVDSKAGKIYLVCTTSIGSTQDSYQNLRLFKIEKNDLNEAVKLIKTSSGLTDSVGFGYNFFSVVEREERPIRLILFDKKSQTFKIPVVINDRQFPNGRVTEKFISYRFDGRYFVKTK